MTDRERLNAMFDLTCGLFPENSEPERLARVHIRNGLCEALELIQRRELRQSLRVVRGGLTRTRATNEVQP